MPIIDIEQYRKTFHGEADSCEANPDLMNSFESVRSQVKSNSSLTAITTRFFFILLLLLTLLWLAVAVSFYVATSVLHHITFRSSSIGHRFYEKSLVNMKRAAVCLIALLVALFSPALGIMFSCLYFMVYDQLGIDEIIPTSVKNQFKEFFPK
jgi:hypothetical protein